MTVLQDNGNVATYADYKHVLIPIYADIKQSVFPVWHAGTSKCRKHVRYWDKLKVEARGFADIVIDRHGEAYQSNLRMIAAKMGLNKYYRN